MKKVFTLLLIFSCSLQLHSQRKFGNWYERKSMFGVEVDAAPLCSLNGQISRMGIGGGIVYEYAPSTSFSIALNAGVLPFISISGDNDGHEGTILVAPVMLSLRKYFSYQFFIAPKIGYALDLSGDDYTINTVDNSLVKNETGYLLYGFGIGVRPTRQKMNVEMAFVAQKLPYGTINMLQFNYRYYFLRNIKNSK